MPIFRAPRRSKLGFAAIIASVFSTLGVGGEPQSYRSVENPSTDLVLETAKNVCNSYASERVDYELHCTGVTCSAEGTVQSASINGDIILTGDLRFLLPDPSSEHYYHTRLKVDGVDVLIIREPFILTESPQYHDKVKNIRECFSKAGDQLATSKLRNNNLEFESAAAKSGEVTTIEPVLRELDFGKITIAYSSKVDVRQDAIISVQFIPGQRFSLKTEPITDEYFELLTRTTKDVINKKVSDAVFLQGDPFERTPAPLQGGVNVSGSSFEMKHNGDNASVSLERVFELKPVAGKLAALSIQLQSDDGSVIVPLTTSRHPLVPLNPSTWIWKIRFDGKSTNTMVRVLLNDGNAAPEASAITVYNLEIQVLKPWDYKIQEFFSRYWQWIIATLVLPYVIHPLKSLFPKREGKVHVPLKEKIRKSGSKDRR
ncbi:hypothetical protein [Caballeronia sp. SBC2]|uniref:hypothetical protein n=1 Tax=Caballeronia sp. SBC2 TaxID=2705547 RepID=UPI0013E19411|nr:hypothetical protein [Caballeronia sp. SBC2]QIE30215.1 hypothetical protein SBC2_82910 [Caballeronia sp. SBC2]